METGLTEIGEMEAAKIRLQARWRLHCGSCKVNLANLVNLVKLVNYLSQLSQFSQFDH